MVETADYDKTATPTAHHASHENGGADEITVLGLSGLLADPQVAVDHAVTHQNSGFDEISVAGLSGLLADGQTPLGHKTSHQAGGADVVDADTLDTLHASAFSLSGHNHAGVYEPVIAAGTSAQYWRGDKTWQTLNQAAIAGLLTTDGPTFAHLHLSDLAAIYAPAESWIGPSNITGAYFKDGNVGIGIVTPGNQLHIYNPAGLLAGLRVDAIAATGANGGCLVLNTPAGSNHLIYEVGGIQKWIEFIDASNSLVYYRGGAANVEFRTGGVLYILNQLGIGMTPTYKIDVAGNIRCSTGFGCNGSTPQTPYASGGAITPGAGAFGASSAVNFAAMITLLQNIQSALIANGIMS